MQRRSFLGAMGGIPTLALVAPALAVPPTVAQKSATAKPAILSRRVGIAFGGGSVHGVAHLGVLKAFAEKGLKFDFIAGTSVGAIIGVLTAAQLPVGEIELITRRIEWPSLMDISWSGRGLLQHNKLRSLIDTSLAGRRLEKLPIPFGAIATDVTTGERIVIRKGPAGAAVSASSSIPVMFEPVKIDGRHLVDGGLTEPVPVIAVREMGANVVIGVDVAFRPNEEPFQGLAGVAFQTMHIMANALIKEQMPRADIVIRMNLHKLVDEDNTHDRLIAAGYAAAMGAWPGIARILS